MSGEFSVDGQGVRVDRDTRLLHVRYEYLE